jgi:hypothetical protein
VLTFLLVAAAVAVFGGSTVAIYRAAARSAPPNRQLPEHVERGIRELLPKDVVGYENRDYIVEGVIEYDEDSHRWSAARLVDESGERWILSGIEQAPGGPVRFLQPTTAVSVSGYPPEELELAGDKYRMNQRGNATVTAKGDVGVTGMGKTLLRIRYWRYSAPGDKLLLVEQWGSDFRVSTGTVIPDHLFTMLPGS